MGARGCFQDSFSDIIHVLREGLICSGVGHRMGEGLLSGNQIVSFLEGVRKQLIWKQNIVRTSALCRIPTRLLTFCCLLLHCPVKQRDSTNYTTLNAQFHVLFHILLMSKSHQFVSSYTALFYSP